MVLLERINLRVSSWTLRIWDSLILPRIGEITGHWVKSACFFVGISEGDSVSPCSSDINVVFTSD